MRFLAQGLRTGCPTASTRAAIILVNLASSSLVKSIGVRAPRKKPKLGAYISGWTNGNEGDPSEKPRVLSRNPSTRAIHSVAENPKGQLPIDRTQDSGVFAERSEPFHRIFPVRCPATPGDPAPLPRPRSSSGPSPPSPPSPPTTRNPEPGQIAENPGLSWTPEGREPERAHSGVALLGCYARSACATTDHQNRELRFFFSIRYEWFAVGKGVKVG
jgi:hypothetical protein